MATKKTPPIHPDDELDDLSQEILRIEILNPGISTNAVKKLINRPVDVRTIQKRRKLALYKRTLSEARKEGLELVKGAEAQAIRELIALLKAKDPRVRFAAAQSLAKGVLEQRHLEIATQEGQSGEQTIRIIFNKKPALMGIDDKPIQHSQVVIEVEQNKKEIKVKKTEDDSDDDAPFGMT